jgi:hypothetical protein
VKHLDKKSFEGLGSWLNRKWISAQNRKNAAQEVLDELNDMGIMEDLLRNEWAAQVEEQTKPIDRKSKSAADKVIIEILGLRQRIEANTAELQQIELMLEGEEHEGDDMVELQLQMEVLKDTSTKLRRIIQQKRKSLTVDGRLNLERLLGDQFLRDRMNALALKKRIRTRLCQRKFELENLERAYRNTVNSRKLQSHVEGKMKKREPGIMRLVTKYNKLCENLTSMINMGEAPRGAIPPYPIEREGLFKLDVDDEVWQDIGLNNDNNVDGDLPLWLSDDNVRQGIKALLELDRCDEEQRRLCKERQNMQEWMIREWNYITLAKEMAEDVDVLYQMQLRGEYLKRLCILWQARIHTIPGEEELPTSWGPSFEELAQTRQYEFTASTHLEEEVSDDGSSDGIEDDEVDEVELLAAMEQFALVDAYDSE